MLKNAFYTAICTDNRGFWVNGKIKVRIFQFSGIYVYDKNGKQTFADDLSAASNDIRETNKTENNDTVTNSDFEAYVFTPLGGGRNYGLFMLPQINSRGVVTFLDNDQSKLLWMGSFFENIRVDNSGVGMYSNNINIPNDDPARENGYVDGIDKNDNKLDGITAKTSKLLSSTTFAPIILRTRHTAGDSQAGLNWKAGNNTENLVVLGDSIVRVRHNAKWDNDVIEKYQEIMIYNDSNNSSKETIQLDVNNVKSGKEKQGIFKLTEDGLTISITDKSVTPNKTNTFEITTSGAGINFRDQFGNSILGDSQGLTINSDTGGNPKLKVNINGNAVSLVTYDQLKIIAEAFRDHIHYGETNSLITSPPIKSDKTPMPGVVNQPISKMEAEFIKTVEKP